jgi:hypothetical protein
MMRRAAIATIAVLLWPGAAAVAAVIACGGTPLADEGVPLPVRAVFEPERLRHLPATVRRLLAREDLQIVQLGDSIVGNTFGPQYGPAGYHVSTSWGMEPVAQEFGGPVWSTVSVLGSTGVWYYRDPAHLELHVLRYTPDLVMIGGISNRGDIAAMRDVIAQIRAALPAAEIVLMTGAVNLQALPVAPSLPAGPAPGTWEAALRDLSRELGTGFIDLRASYDDFVVRAHGFNPALDHAWFQADPVHANERGRVLLREIVAMYFRGTRPCNDGVAPPVPAPVPLPLAYTTLLRRPAPVTDVAGGDVNGDGVDDLVVLAAGGPAAIFLGPLEGADPARSPDRQIAGVAPLRARLANINDDALPDLAGSDAAGMPVIAIGRAPQGLGADATAAVLPAAVALQAFELLDANDDGRTDFVGLRADGGGLRLWLNRNGQPDGFEFADVSWPASGGDPAGLAALDVDRDGRDDLVALLRSAAADRAWLQVEMKGAGGFQSGAGSWRVPLNLQAAAGLQRLDMDADGEHELAVFGGATDPWIYVYRPGADGPGALLEPAVLAKADPAHCPVAAMTADLDHDGRRDLVVQGDCSGTSGRVDFYQGGSDIPSLVMRAPESFVSASRQSGLTEIRVDRAGQRAIVVGVATGDVLALQLLPPPPPADPDRGGGGVAGIAWLAMLASLTLSRAACRRTAG